MSAGSAPISPLAPASFPELPPVGGVELSTFAGGLRYQDRDDLMLASFPFGATVAGVFTTSLCTSAPVDWCKSLLSRGTAAAVVCNAGNANAFTGAAGDRSAELTARVVGQLLGASHDNVYLASTGVIGEPMPNDLLDIALPRLVLGSEPSNETRWAAAANAIRTTDTFAKGSSAAVEGLDANVVGIAKGSGMIAPNMATMLGFVFTDVGASAEVLQHCLGPSVTRSYNSITVDSDTSTSDTVLLFATGAAGNELITKVDDPRVPALAAAVHKVNEDLARQIVRDGEGATKFVEVTVTGAASNDAARTIALAIGNSPLVKTALAASDANWGRIVMAVGKAGEKASRDDLMIWIGPEQVTANGMVSPTYDEDAATRHLQQDEVEIKVDVGVGDGHATIWGCDLTHGYIDINASYRS